MTHVNAYKTDVQEALAAARNAISEVDARVAALVEKLEEGDTPTVEPEPAPEPQSFKGTETFDTSEPTKDSDKTKSK